MLGNDSGNESGGECDSSSEDEEENGSPLCDHRRDRTRAKTDQSDKPNLCVVIHSLDGPFLKHHQGVIADLAKHSKVIIVYCDLAPL